MLSFTITKEMVVQLPDELEELRLGNSYEKGLDLSPYFGRINSTLRVLELDSLPKNAQFLMELKELRQSSIVEPLTIKNCIELEEYLRMNNRQVWISSREWIM